MTSRTFRRAAALEAAATYCGLTAGPHTPGRPAPDPRVTAKHVLDLAVLFDAWLAVQPPVASFTILADVPVDRPISGDTVSLTFPDTQECTLHVAGAVDAEGAAVTDTFTWTVDNASVLTLTPAADTTSCLIVPGTTAGAATVTATASDGVARTFAVDVTTGPTADFQITADAPVDRPAATPAPATGA